jgi:hypothetical protein
VPVLGLAGSDLDGGGTTEPGVGRFVAAPSRVRPGYVETDGGDGTNPDLSDELGGGLVNQPG